MRNPIELLTRSTFWAIRPESVSDAIFALLHRTTADSSESGRWEAAKPSTIGRAGNKVAVVPIQGVLTKDGPSWYGSSYDGIAKAMEDATADPEVKSIVLTVDSPGGEVTGLPETAAIVAAAAKVKPVHAIVEGMSASAAYWLTSQASSVALTPSGEVGSVGVRMMHADVSGMLDKVGVKITELYSGDHKTEWSPYKPLSEDAKADMQPRLEAVHQEFINTVDAGRGERVSADMRAKRFGEGRMFSASDAVTHGLVDKIQSSRDFMRTILPPVEQATTGPAFPLRLRHEVAVAQADGCGE